MTESQTPEVISDVASEIERAVNEAPQQMNDAITHTISVLETGLPQSFRAMAEKAADQTRDSYQKAKDNMEETMHALEEAFTAYGQGASAFNHRLIELTQANMNSGFEFVKSLAGMKDFSEIASAHSDFMRKQMETFSNQASEIHAMSSKLAEDAAEPIKAQMTRSLEKYPQGT